MTIVQGLKDHKLPPLLPEGQAEYCFATVAKDDPLSSSLYTNSNSSFVFTRIWRAVAFIPSGGDLYSSLENALLMASKNPICSAVVRGELEHDDGKQEGEGVNPLMIDIAVATIHKMKLSLFMIP